jgi:hypothetical protein
MLFIEDKTFALLTKMLESYFEFAFPDDLETRGRKERNFATSRKDETRK